MADKTCPVIMANGKECGIDPGGSDNFCIFHRGSKGANDFKKLLDEKIKLENNDDTINEIDFTKYIFPDYEFSEIVFSKSVIFNYSKFLGIVLYKDCQFNGEKNEFGGCTFEGERIEFYNVDFKGDYTNFNLCHFSSKKETKFNRIKFNSVYTHFEDCIFSSASNKFIRCNFDGSLTNFSLATFNHENIFTSTQFNSNVTNFNSCRIKDKLEFWGNNDNRIFNSKASFNNLRLETLGLIVFQHVNFNQVEFRGTDLRKIEFIDVHWCDIQRYRFWLPPTDNFNGLYDEIILRKNNERQQSEIELTRHAYRQLKHNYEENKNYYQADHFYFGEMEMSRNKIKNFFKRNIFSWQALYRISSGYGQQWENSFTLLFITLFLFPLIYMFTGVALVDASSVLAQYINYDLAWNFPDINQTFKDYELCLRYSVITIFPIKEVSSFKPDIWTRYLLIGEIVLLPTFATLFILALKRRFKR